MQETMRPYKEIYEEKKKRKIQTKLSMFVKRTSKPASSTIDATPSPASTSGYQQIPHAASPDLLPDLSLNRTHEESVDDVQPKSGL